MENVNNKGSYKKALCAVVHIARSQLDIAEDDYRDIIEAHFPGKRSSKSLGIGQLHKLIKYFESKGFKSQGGQVTALRIRAKGLLDKAVAGGLVTSANGLVKSICEVDDLAWCKDASKLKRLLAVLSNIEQGR